MAGVLVLRRLQLLAQGLRLVDHLAVVLVHLVQQIPVLRELLERGRAHDKIEEARRTGAVHAARTRSQLVLKIGDLSVGFIDFDLLGFHGSLSNLLRVERLLVTVGGGFEIRLKADELVADGVRLGLLLRSRRRECGRRSYDRCGTEHDGTANERSPAKSVCMLSHSKTS